MPSRIALREIPLREIPLFRLGRAISSPFVTFYLRFSECVGLDDLVNVSAPESCRTKDYFRINELARLLSSDFRNVGRPLMTPASGAQPMCQSPKNHHAEWRTLVSMEAIVLAFGFAALIGIFFRFYP